MARQQNLSAQSTQEHDETSFSRPRRVRRTPRWLIAIPVALAFGALSTITVANLGQYQEEKAQADAKAEQLAELRAQHDAMKRRLAFLQLPKGREQTLLEHGYIRPARVYCFFPAKRKLLLRPIKS
jgi:hypothetical protein